jgi:transposase-like protein
VQACIIHLIRNTFRYASRRDWDAMSKDLRPVYTAPTEPSAAARFEEFTERWGGQYPAITTLWRNAWPEFIPFLDYGACRRIAECSCEARVHLDPGLPDCRDRWRGSALGAVRRWRGRSS